MTSSSTPAYPAEYYYPEFIESRSDDPRVSPPPRPPLASSVAAMRKRPQLTEREKEPTNLAADVVTNTGLPGVDITQSVKTDPKKSLIRDPIDKNIPRLIVDDNVIPQVTYLPAMSTENSDDENNESNQIAHGDLRNKTKVQTKSMESVTQKRAPITENKNPNNEYWKKEVAIDDEGAVSIKPVIYDKNTYEGPFGLTRKGGIRFYLFMGIFTFLAAAFLIITGVFYARNFPDSSSNSGKIAGMGICGLAFYLGMQLILIAIWQQKYRRENPKKIVHRPRRSSVHNDSSDYLKTSMEGTEQYDSSYQHVDNTPYGYYSSPPYVSNVNENMLLQQPGAATGLAYYEPVVWPSNVEIETQPDSKFFQSMDWSYGPLTQPSSTDLTALQSPVFNPENNQNLSKKKRTLPTKSVEAEPPEVEFDDILFKSTVIEEPLPSLTKAPETAELIKSIAQMERKTQLSPIYDDDVSSKRSHRLKHSDSKTDVSYDNHRHHRHHHRRHHSPHHHRHRSTHHHHHHRHHDRHSYSPCSQCSPYTHSDFHRERIPYHHHHQYSEPPPKIITPNFPKIITPTVKVDTAIYRDTGVNTGNETKIMRDSSVTADLEDIPNIADNRLEQIPVVRRTIIVEPYPAQPSSQILVKPRADMIGKIRLGTTTKIDGENETIVYPSTAFMTKKSKKKKKKKKTVVNDIFIEDLQLEDVNDDNGESMKTKRSKIDKTPAKIKIKNAFYN